MEYFLWRNWFNRTANIKMQSISTEPEGTQNSFTQYTHTNSCTCFTAVCLVQYETLACCSAVKISCQFPGGQHYHSVSNRQAETLTAEGALALSLPSSLSLLFVTLNISSQTLVCGISWVLHLGLQPSSGTLLCPHQFVNSPDWYQAPFLQKHCTYSLKLSRVWCLPTPPVIAQSSKSLHFALSHSIETKKNHCKGIFYALGHKGDKREHLVYTHAVKSAFCRETFETIFYLMPSHFRET